MADRLGFEKEPIPFGFRLTGDPQVVEIVADLVPLGGRVIGRVSIKDESSSFSPDVWRWKIDIDNEGASSAGGYLQVPRRRAPDAARLALIAACPTPVYHETHRYCPSCPWTEEDG